MEHGTDAFITPNMLLFPIISGSFCIINVFFLNSVFCLVFSLLGIVIKAENK